MGLKESQGLLSVQSGNEGEAKSAPARWRILVIALLWLCNVSLYLSRANISIAALYMFDECMEWQKWVFAAFFLGYTLSQVKPCSFHLSQVATQKSPVSLQIPAGHLAGQVGGKAVLFTGVTVWSTCTFLCVPCFLWSVRAPWPLVICRVFIGMAEGCNYPSQIALVGKWIPEHERTTAWNALTVGEAGGTIIAMLTSPWLANHGGWPVIFYVSGGLGAVWLLLFGALVTESPETHWGISAAERDYIVATRQKSVGSRSAAPAQLTSVPWWAIVSHGPFLATVCAHSCYNYMSFLALSLGPYFFKTKYNVDISTPSSSLGIYACLPYVLLFVAQALAGALADRSRNSGALSLITVRKLFNTAGLVIAAGGFAALASPWVQSGSVGREGLFRALSLLTVSVGIGGIAITGHWANYRDLSSVYGSHLLAIGTSVATIPGMVTNIVSGDILDQIQRNPAATGEAWAQVFYITASISLVGAIVFALFATATQIDFDKRAECLRGTSSVFVSGGSR